MRVFIGLFFIVSIICSIAIGGEEVTLNQKADGFRGIWYQCGVIHNEYVYKYSGGLGTYCAKHSPFAIYSKEADKTFFCYGGSTKENSTRLLHMVSYYDHKTGLVARPTVLLDKKTEDAHDNPVISLDDDGYIWIFSTSHGTGRPSYIHKSKEPFDVSEFVRVDAVRKDDSGKEVPLDNFSYFQAYNVEGKFFNFFTRYNYPAQRTICYMTSDDGVKWSKFNRIAAMDLGHYEVGNVTEGKAATAFDYHPKGRGLDWRTNLYYLETVDDGVSWQTVDGKKVTLPLTEPNSIAMVKEYESKKLNVYLKKLLFDKAGRPVILYITSKGWKSGPENDPRVWTIAHWNGKSWDINPVTQSDNNYDFGAFFIDNDGTWQIIAPTETGPQPYNPGGEIAMWISKDQGKSWQKVRQLTKGSEYNHTFARCVVNANDDFYAFWADGHCRKPSDSRLYFCNKAGDVYQLPVEMEGEFARPVRMFK